MQQYFNAGKEFCFCSCHSYAAHCGYKEDMRELAISYFCKGRCCKFNGVASESDLLPYRNETWKNESRGCE